MKPIPGFRSRRGFTLLELLVVIGLISALSTLGFSGFRAARTRANQAVSAGNLRQLASANLLYVADYQTYAPASAPNNLTRWHGGRASMAGKFDPEKGFLSEYLGLSHRVEQCPEFKCNLSSSNSWEDGSGGYGYNATYIGGTPPNPFQPNRPANVPNPARTLMFATTAFAVAGGVQEYPFADPPKSVDSNWCLRGSLQPSVNFRFNGKALIAWCDGHVSEESLSGGQGSNYYGGDNKDAAVGFCGPTENNGWWNPRN